MTNILTRDTIEKILNGEHTSNKISIRSALETALALFDKLDLANEEIRHAYSDNETHRRRISELEAENKRLKYPSFMNCPKCGIVASWQPEPFVRKEASVALVKDCGGCLALEAENERLKQMVCHPIDFAHWKKELEAENCQLEQYRRWYDEETAPLRAENAKLREQLRLTQIDWNNEASENAALREVVEASKKLSAHLDIVHGSFYSPNGLSPSKMLNDILKAALAKVEGK